MSEKKLRIAFFGDDFSRQGKGTALAIQKIAEELFCHYKNEVKIVLLSPPSVIKNPIGRQIQNVKIPRYFSTTLSYMWFFLSHHEQYDAVVFNRVVYPGFWFLRSKKFILFLYDAPQSKVYTVPKTLANSAFEYFLRFFGKHFLNAVVAVSNDAKTQIVSYYNILPKKIHVLYLGTSDDFKMFSTEEREKWKKILYEKYNIRSPYILDVSRLDPHKNIHRVLDAFFSLKQRQRISYNLVLVGGKHTIDYTRAIEEQIKNSLFYHDIIMTDYIAPEDMPALYNCAAILVFPSLVEGFGLPVVEAMKCGIPVITSNISSLPEISQGAAYLVSPLNTNEIAETMMRVLSESDLYKNLVEHGLRVGRSYSWENATKQFVSIIKK